MEIKSSLLKYNEFKYLKNSLIKVSELDDKQNFRVKLIEYINDTADNEDDMFFFEMLPFVRFLFPNDKSIAYTTPEHLIYLNTPGKPGENLRMWDFIYCHECLHQLWDTFDVGNKLKKDGIEYNHKLLNIASDCVINDFLKSMRGKTPYENGIFPESLKEEFGIEYDRKYDTQYSLYLKLLDVYKEQRQALEDFMKEFEDQLKDKQGQGQGQQDQDDDGDQNGQQGGGQGSQSGNNSSGNKGGNQSNGGTNDNNEDGSGDLTAKDAQKAANDAKKYAKEAQDKANSGDGTQDDADKAAKAAKEAQDAADKAKECADDKDAEGEAKAAKEAQDAANKAKECAEGKKGKNGKNDGDDGDGGDGKDGGDAGNNPPSKTNSSNVSDVDNISKEEAADMAEIIKGAEDIIDKYRNKLSGPLGEYISKCYASSQLKKDGLQVKTYKGVSGWNTKMNQIINAYVKKRVFQKKRQYESTYKRIKRGSGFIKWGDPIKKGKRVKKDTFNIDCAYYLDISGSMGSSVKYVFDAVFRICEALKKQFGKEQVVDETIFRTWVFNDYIKEIKFGNTVSSSGCTMPFNELLRNINKFSKEFLINVVITDAQFDINVSDIKKLLDDIDGIVLFITNSPNKTVEDLSKKYSTKLYYIIADSEFKLDK